MSGLPKRKQAPKKNLFSDHKPKRMTSEQEQKRKESSKMMLQSIIELNNTGAGLIASGDYKRAFVPLWNALKITKQCMAVEKSQDCCTHRRTTSLDMCIAHTPSECLPSADENEHYMHRQAICIPPSFLLEPQSQQDVRVLLSAVIIFNLALLHQLSAQQDDEKRLAKLTKAAKLYTLIYELQRSNRFENNVWFVMATMNNLGLVHTQLQDATNADRCFESFTGLKKNEILHGKTGSYTGGSAKSRTDRPCAAISVKNCF
jgi:hypothetical protein